MSVTVQKIRVPVSELRTGMFVCEIDRPWTASPFLFQGFPLQSTEDVCEVQRHCSYVYVDPEKSTDWGSRGRKTAPAAALKGVTQTLRRVDPNAHSARHTPPANWVRSTLARRRGSIQAGSETLHRIDVAQRSFGWTTRLVQTALSDVRLGRSLDIPSAKEAVNACADQITRDPDAMLLLGSIKSKDSYTSQHSVNVAIFSMILGHRIGLPRAKLKELGLSALLHDVGKVLIPDEILKKPARLTAEEFVVMRRHTIHGREVLTGCDGMCRAALDVAHDHHERLDGSGYPRGLREDNTGLHTKIVAIADTFDAITSDRVYGSARTTIEAFKVLRGASGNNYDGHLVSELIAALGIFPPGSVVQLNNGRYGVVVRTNAKHTFRPLVLVVRDANLRELRPRYLDLSDARDRIGRPIQIAKMVRGDDCDIDTAMFRNPQFLQALTR